VLVVRLIAVGLLVLFEKEEAGARRGEVEL